jgi:hypothetical protein
MRYRHSDVRIEVVLNSQRALASESSCTNFEGKDERSVLGGFSWNRSYDNLWSRPVARLLERRARVSSRFEGRKLIPK